MNDQRKTEEKVFAYMEEHNMTSPGHGVVVGVSGGADSVCLLFVLLEYAKRVPLRLTVAHVDHGIRQDAGEDAVFVERLCRQEDIPFFLRNVDVKAFAAGGKCSEEEAGRILRYRAFREVAVSCMADRIAVAHNGNDLAETTLFHLFRGTGLKGLCGIPPVREEVIRPLLCLQRSEIEEYLRVRGIPYRIDSTNLGDDYTRNRIRHYVLPYAEEQVSAKAVAHICKTAELLSEVEEYLERQTQEAMARCVEAERTDEPFSADVPESREDGSVRFLIDVGIYGGLHRAIQKRLLLRLIRQLAPGHRDISSVHVEEVSALFEKEGNPGTSLPFGISAQRSYGQVILWRGAGTADEDPQARSVQIELPYGETDRPVVYEMGELGQVEFSVFFLGKGQKIPRDRYTKWFDRDKIMEPPLLRFRQTGDFFCIADGHGGVSRKMLKDYMITEKIPRKIRGRVPLLAEGDHVLWIIGYRISEHYKINENTKRVLQVKLLGSCHHSGTEEKDGGTHQSTFIGKGSGREDPGDW